MDALGLLGLNSSGGGGSADLRLVGHCGEHGGINYTEGAGKLDGMYRYIRNKSFNPNGASRSQSFESEYVWLNYSNNSNWDVKFVSITVNFELQNTPYMADTVSDQFVLYNSGDHTYNQSTIFRNIVWYPHFHAPLSTQFPGVTKAITFEFDVEIYCVTGWSLETYAPSLPKRSFLQYSLMIADYLYN